MFRLASDTMDDDAALAQILAANDELTLAVNAYKEKVGSKECNGGRERSRSEEEMEGITKGWPFFSASSPCREHLNLVFASAVCCFHLMFLLVPSAPTSPREIKSYHLIDLSALDSPQTHRKTDSPPSFESSSPMFASLMESFDPVADQDFNELGLPALYLFLCLCLFSLMVKF